MYLFPDIVKDPVILGYNFDTLKANGDLLSFSPSDLDIFNDVVSRLIQIKKKVQENTFGASSSRYLEYLTNTNIPYRIYAQAVTGFSVSVATTDFTIFLRKINPLTHDEAERQIHIKVEFRAKSLWSYGLSSCIKKFDYFLSDLLNTFSLSSFSFIKLSSFLIVSEVHFALDTQGYNFKKADSYRFKTILKERRFYGDIAETLYLGATSSTQQFRIYNKTVLEDKTGDDFFQKMYLQHKVLDSTMPIWRIEMQLRGKFLRDRGIIMPLDLATSRDFMQSIIAIFFGSISFRMAPRDFIMKRLCDVEMSKIEQFKILDGSSVFPFWERFQKEILNIEPTRYKIVDKTQTKKIKYVSNALKALFSTAMSVTGTSLGASELLDVLVYANEVHKESTRMNGSEGIDSFQSFYKKHKMFDIEDIDSVGNLGFWQFLEKNLDWHNKGIFKNSLAKAIEFFHPRKRAIETDVIFCSNLSNHYNGLRDLAYEYGLV
jgi:hypothetical protein